MVLSVLVLMFSIVILVHRVGRTARAGHPGKATALFVPGFEVDEGNGKIADALVSLLNEKNQVASFARFHKFTALHELSMC